MMWLEAGGTMVSIGTSRTSRCCAQLSDSIVVEVEILVSWPAGKPTQLADFPVGGLELSDCLRHCLDEDGDVCCSRGYSLVSSATSLSCEVVAEGRQAAGGRW